METAGSHSIDAQVPISQNVNILAEHLKAGDPNVVIYVVGGAVRDYLHHLFRHDYDKRQYHPKDVDLTTNLSEEEILDRLRTPEAQRAGIKVKEKESIDTFGVVFTHIGGEDFEIAPFRKDIGSADGRRPEETERGTIYDDAMRRDLTMNNLYYDFENHKILDFNNPPGQGIEDIKNGVARPVGNPFERFREDKLRVLRLIRFFSRFNDENITQKLDQNTRDAIERYQNLQGHGITPERIYMEFTAGVKQSLNTAMFLKNIASLNLMQTVFPALNVDIQGIDRLGNSKNIKVILAWLLRDNQNVAGRLTKLKYPNEITNRVAFLLKLYERFQTSSSGMSKIHSLTKERDRYIDPNYSPEQQQQMSMDVQQDIQEFSRVLGADINPDRLAHFASYKPPQIDAQELISRGLQGPQIGQEQDRIRDQHYNQSFENWLKKRQTRDGVRDFNKDDE